MTKRTPGYLAVTSLVLTLLWLILLIADQAGAGRLATFEQMAAHARQAGRVTWLGYINAALITIVVTMLFASLYARYRHAAPVWSQIGLVFIPVYCTINLAVYLLQVTAVPALLAQPQDAVTTSLLQLLMQSWPASSVAFFNNLAYALLGIPSILYGALMVKEGGLMRLAGLLLAANGAVCILGLLGILFQVPVLSAGSLIGGVLFLLALFPLSWELLRD